MEKMFDLIDKFGEEALVPVLCQPGGHLLQFLLFLFRVL